MNMRFLASVAAVFVADTLLNFLVHGVMLGHFYSALVPKGVFRTPEDSQNYFLFMPLQSLLFAIGFTWIYRQGRDARPWLGQGLRFGLAVAVMAIIPTYLVYYVVTPLPGDLVFQQCAYGLVQMLVVGVIAAAINRDRPAAGA
jgi:hypothetical protein